MKKSWLRKKIRISSTWLLLAAFVSTSLGMYHYAPDVRALIGGRQSRGVANSVNTTKQAPPRLGEGAQAYFPFDDNAENKVETNRTNLTDNNTVTSAMDPEKKAAQFTSANSEYLSVASNTTLQTGDINYTISMWFYLDSTSAHIDLMSKDNVNNLREYALFFNSSTKLVTFYVSNGGSTVVGQVSWGNQLNALQWYHLVAWHNASTNQVGISLNNGTPVTASTSGAAGANSQQIEIGRDALGRYMNGRIDEIGFWKKVLSSSERTELYNSFNGRVYSDMSTSLKTSLVAYWPLDEASGTRYDLIGSNNLTDNNTVTSGTPKVTKRVTRAAQFTRANSEYLSSTQSNDLKTGDTDFTLAAWVYMDSKPSDLMNVFGKWGGSGGNEYTLDWLNTDDRFRFVVDVNGGGNTFGTVTANTFGATNIKTWYFIVAWHDAANNQIGISVNGSTDTTTHSTGVNSSNNSEIRIGSLDSSAPRYWDGRIDNVAFWRRVLTSDERSTLYNRDIRVEYDSLSTSLKQNLMTWWSLDEDSGTRVDQHANRMAATSPTVASGVTQVAGRYGYAYDFPGTAGNHITVPDNDALDFNGGDMSITTWLYLDSTANTVVLAHKGDGSSNAYQFSYINNGTIQFCISTCKYSNTSGITTGKWYHVAVTFTDATDTVAFYVNGVEKGSHTDLTNSLSLSSYNLYIGSLSNNYYLDGKLDELRLYSKALSSDEIIALIRGVEAPECDQSCKLWYKMDEASGTTATDYSGNANTGTASASTLGVSAGILGLAGDFASGREIQGASDFSLTNLTTMAWIHPSSSCNGSETRTITSKGVGSHTSNTDFIFNIGSSACNADGNVLGAYIVNGWKKSTSTISPNTWTHVAMTFDGTTVRFYINGSLDREVASSGSIVDTAEVASVGIQGTNNYNGFIGLIDDARIYDRVLSDGEIKDYYLRTRPL